MRQDFLSSRTPMLHLVHFRPGIRLFCFIETTHVKCLCFDSCWSEIIYYLPAQSVEFQASKLQICWNLAPRSISPELVTCLRNLPNSTKLITQLLLNLCRNVAYSYTSDKERRRSLLSYFEEVNENLRK